MTWPIPNAAALFLYLNAGKHGVTLDLEQAHDRQTLDALLAGADILIHNGRRPIAPRGDWIITNSAASIPR